MDTEMQLNEFLDNEYLLSKAVKFTEEPERFVLGLTINLIRTSLGLSQQKMADEVFGVESWSEGSNIFKKEQISRWENGVIEIKEGNKNDFRRAFPNFDDIVEVVRNELDKQRGKEILDIGLQEFLANDLIFKSLIEAPVLDEILKQHRKSFAASLKKLAKEFEGYKDIDYSKMSGALEVIAKEVRKLEISVNWE